MDRVQNTSAPYITIRELNSLEQIDEVYRLGLDMSYDVDLHETVDPDFVKRTCAVLLTDMDRNTWNVFIAYQGTTPVGFVVSTCQPCFHRQGIVAEQKLWYVSKEFRGTWAAVKLIRAYERWARLNGATQIFTGTANAHYAEKTTSLLNKIGYRTVGALLVKEI